MRKYTLKYTLEPGEFIPDKDARTKYGLTDQILLCSYLEEQSGSGSYAWVSNNGTVGVEMEWGRQMHCWLMLTKQLADEAPDDCPNQKRALNEIFEVWRTAILNRTLESKK